MTREPVPYRDSSTLTKLLAVLLLLVAGALVFTVIQNRHNQGVAMSIEPRPIAQRPDDKLGADEQGTIDIFSKFSRSVVNVTSLATRTNQITLDVTQIKQGTGSGIVWDQAGHIVTNFHVVSMGDSALVTLNDNTSYPAKIVGVAPDKDLAVLQITAPAQKLLPVPLGQSSSLKVGQKVLAIGNPFGLDQTLTTGVISGLGREIKSMSGATIQDVIQTDASINPGNSGGPLLDSSGRLIGINTAIYSPSGANAGIGFAVPVDTINQVVPQLIEHGKIIRPGLGVNIANDSVAARLNIDDGVLIISVAPNSAAEQAGLTPTRQTTDGLVLGDVILAMDGVAIHNGADLHNAFEAHKVGDTVTLALQNNGQRREVKVTLQALP